MIRLSVDVERAVSMGMVEMVMIVGMVMIVPMMVVFMKNRWRPLRLRMNVGMITTVVSVIECNKLRLGEEAQKNQQKGQNGPAAKKQEPCRCENHHLSRLLSHFLREQVVVWM
jgi:hypothetical protein